MSNDNGVLTVEKIRKAVEILKAAKPTQDWRYPAIPDGEFGRIDGITFVESIETEEQKIRREAIEYNIAQRPVRKKKFKPNDLATEVMEYWHKETMKHIYTDMFGYSDKYENFKERSGSEIKYLTYESSPPK